MKETKKDVNNIKLALKIAIFIIIVIFVFLLGYFLNSLGNTSKEDIITEENLNDVIESDWKTPKGTKGEVNIYESIEYKSYHVEQKAESDEVLKDETKYKKKYTYKCSNSDCVGIDMYEYLNYVLIKDGNYVLYDYDTNRFKEIKLDGIEFEKIRLLYFENKVYGYALTNRDNKVAIYNAKKEELITDFSYNTEYYSANPELSDNDLIVTDDEKTYVINFSNGKVRKEFDANELGSDNFYYLQAIGNGKYVYYVKNYGFEFNDSEIYTNEFEKIFDDRFSKYGVLSNGNIIVSKDDNKFYEYKKDGSLVRESKEYKKIICITNGYIVVIDNDDYLKVINNKGKELAKFVKLTVNLSVNDLLSNWYKIGKKEGIFITVEDQSVEPDTKGRIIEYYYQPENNKTGKIILSKI